MQQSPAAPGLRAISASNVARTLHKGGQATVLQHTRDGLSVARTHRIDTVTVAASVVGSIAQERLLVDAAVEILVAAGYTVERTNPARAIVTRPA